MAVAVPPDNAVDVYTNDVGFIAIIENDEVSSHHEESVDKDCD
jgi:sulfite reductase (NADPH) hemoprotein beta-component